MDTKWKKWTGRAGFLLFAAGISLLLYHGAWMLRRAWSLGASPAEIVRSVEESFQEDYQRTGVFRHYMESTLEQFLVMAANGNVYDFYGWGSYNYSDDLLEETIVRSTATSEMAAEYGYDSTEQDYEAWEYYQEEPLTEEEKRARIQKIHDRRKEDKNLLYVILYDGEVRYANTEELKLENGELTAPEGYNFLMYFDGSQVTITKDGQKPDIYGDGYYREDSSEWYVPGYRNFTVDEDTKRAQIYMAAAKEPLLYTVNRSSQDGYSQYDNRLYWIRTNLSSERKAYCSHALGLAAGLVLLFFSLFFRKGKKQTKREIAGLTGKLWLELKLLIFGGILCTGVVYAFFKGMAYFIDEMYYEYFYFGNDAVFGEALGTAVGNGIGGVSPFGWVLGFWTIYLAVLDSRYHKQVWKKSLCYSLYRRFSAKSMEHPLAKRMAHRNALVLILIVIYGALNIGGLCALTYICGYEYVWAEILFAAGGLVLLVAVFCLTGGKNMAAARDLDVMARRIQEIHDGNYGEPSETVRSKAVCSETASSESELSEIVSSGVTPSEATQSVRSVTGSIKDHELGVVMQQVEEIRQGMSSAVEEQMKSERMKVELIANVSHDIKTPLTSIISYVQFLKQEEGLPEHVRDYIRILDEKSQRLKNMVQDVFMVSKAASGQLPVNLEELDLGRLLSQTMADMEEQISQSSVIFKTDIPKEPVMILADGQKMYRVFQNLFQNAMKYSLEGSRVYVTLKTDEGAGGGSRLAVASVKNTSRMEIDQNKNYAERFTRGDMSRSDGGSGLGLSIAQSFTEACGGSFSLETIADLFVVTISFGTV